MDLPPPASASPQSALLLPPTNPSTAHGNPGLPGAANQSGRISQSTAVRPPPSVSGPATEKCAHKDTTRCSLHQRDCCSCADDRPHEQYYERYIDGIGIVRDAPRWAHYCSNCKDHWDRLNARRPPYRENQPRVTAWDLFHLATPPNVPPSAPNLTVSEFARHSLAPSAQAAILAPPEDGFPQSYAIFNLTSPNFSNEYHPVVAEHIRKWGELESRIADEPRYSTQFYTLLAQYHNARHKVKRMTELDRQSRIGDMSVEAADEYFQLLGAPGSFDIPITSGAVSPGVGNVGGGSGSGGPPFVSPNLAGIGASFSRAANLGNFLHSASVAQGGDGGGGGAVEGRDGDTISNPTPAVDSRPSLPSLSRASSSTTASPPSRSSPPRLHRRRGSTPFEMMMTTHTNQQQQQAPTAARSSMVVDRERERERDRDREAGRITAGMSSNAAGAPASADLPSSSPASRSSLPSESPSEAHQNSSYHSHSRRHSLSRTVTSFLRSQRSRTLASVTPDIETDRNVADRRRQLRERNESEWESQRPISSISTANASANRMSTDSTVMDAIMSDLPSSQSSDNPSGSGNSSSSDGTVVSTVESSTPNPSRYPTYFLTSPTGVPWVSPQPPGTSNRTESNDSSPMPTGPSRRDGAGNIPETHSLGSLPEASTSTGSSLATSGFSFPTSRRSFRSTSHEQTATPSNHMPTPDSSSRNSIMSPTNRLSAPANFLPSLPHLPAPRFSPPRNLARPRGGTVFSSSMAGHGRQGSNASDGFPPSFSSRRRERINPIVQTLGSRTDFEREDYDSPIRTMFAQSYDEHQRAEEIRRRGREMEVEHRDFIQNQDASTTEPNMRRLQEHRSRQYELLHRDFLQNQDASTTESNMRRLQEHRSRQYELLHRASLQRQIDQLHAQNRLQTSGSNNPPVGSWYSPIWPVPHNNNNMSIRSPEDSPAHPFGLAAEDEEHSSNSEEEYEDMIPLEDEDGFFTLMDGYIPRFPGNENQPPTARRTSSLRRQHAMNPNEQISAHGQASSNFNRQPGDVMHSRIERSRRYREREADLIQSRHNEAIRDIAGIVSGVRETVMGLPRWNRDHGSTGSVGGGRNGSSGPQTTRTLDHPQRPDNLKEEDLKIMADCKVCYGQVADIVLLPCAHLVLCQWCADTVAPAAPGRLEGAVAPRSNCPVCRARVDNKIKVFRC